MSAAKVIFTYKRKRLSSCSGVGHADVCSDISLDVEVDKHQDVPNEKIRSPEKDLKICKRVNCNDENRSMDCCLSIDNRNAGFHLQNVHPAEELLAAPSFPAVHNSSRLVEKYDGQRSDATNSRKVILDSHELHGDNTCKTSVINVSFGASLGKITNSTANSIEKDSCLPHTSYMNMKVCMQGASVSQPAEKDCILHKHSCLSKTEVAKGKSTVPLRTFSRRPKRKAEACDASTSTKLPLREGDTPVKGLDLGPVHSCTCEVASKESGLVEKSLDINAENCDVGMWNTLCQSSEKMTGSGISASPCPCEQSCAESLVMRQTGKTSDSQERLAVDTSSVVTKETGNRTSGSIASAFLHPDEIGSTSLQKGDARCSSYDGTVVSCNLACKLDEQPLSHQCQASSDDSQLTSSDSSNLKIDAAERVEHKACSNSLDLSHPPTGTFVIDCNVVPESEIQEEASDIILDSSVSRNEKAMQEGNMKSKGLNSVLVENSSHISIRTETKTETKCLQLFSEVGNCSQSTAPTTHSEIGHSKGQQIVEFITGLEQSSSKASANLGSSLHTGPMCEGVSEDGPSTPLFPTSNARTCDLTHNPIVQSFPDQASFRHKLLLESINTRATSLRGNRNISLDKFEPGPVMWSEEELDSLWIGVRRHGKGSWHAMLLDPRLRFAPWRTAKDLEDQWGREQHKLFTGQHMSSSRNEKPQAAYKLHCHGPNGGRRENVTAETQLSLGDVYAHKDGVFSRNSAMSYGISQAQRHVTLASSGGYACGLFNNVQASVTVRGEISSDGPAMTFGMNNCFPHWLRDPISTPSRPLDPHLSPISAVTQMGGLRLVHAFPETTGTFSKGKNPVSTKPVGSHPLSRVQCDNPLTRKPGSADNLIVIDSDASSEETISDDQTIRS